MGIFQKRFCKTQNVSEEKSSQKILNEKTAMDNLQKDICGSNTEYANAEKNLLEQKKEQKMHKNPPSSKGMPMDEVELMGALSLCDKKDEPELIGDYSKPYALPLVVCPHSEFKCISSGTVARLIRGHFDEQVASYKIIDCRYPYEYDGGHIKGAKNLYTQEQIVEEFLTPQEIKQLQRENASAGHKRNIIIFHCEFSIQRGPNMLRFLRNIDRKCNAYPALYYPEVYLLYNGYKEFFGTHVELCNPKSYRAMLEPKFNADYRHYQDKCKTCYNEAPKGRMKKPRL